MKGLSTEKAVFYVLDDEGYRETEYYDKFVKARAVAGQCAKETGKVFFIGQTVGFVKPSVDVDTTLLKEEVE